MKVCRAVSGVVGVFTVWLLLLQTRETHAAPVYFLVAEHPGSQVYYDSYVLPIEDPAAIAHARQLISQGPSAGAPIVTARIAPGSDGINRNYLAPGFPLWSWHVTEFVGFSDITIELCDGWPGFLESDVDGWIQNTGGTICFWSYTVVGELALVPEPSTRLLLGLGTLLAWGIFVRPEWRRRRL